MTIAESQPGFALAYERVSTEDQAESNNSIPAQRRRIDDYAAAHGITIVAHYADAGASAYRDDENRVEFWKMVERAKTDKRVRLVLVDDATRFYRHRAKAVMVKADLRAHGVQVRSVSMHYDPDTVQGVWLEGIDEIRAQASSMETAFATMRAMEQNAMTRDPESGWCYKNGGKAPYGYQAYRVIRGKDSRGKPITKTLWKIDPEQAEAVRLILVELRLGRNLALDKIRDELNARGILPPRGRFWATSCLFEFFRPERVLCYAGSYFWNKEDHKTPGVRYKPRDKWLRVDNAHPPIVTMDEAESVIEATRRRATGRAWHKTDRSRFLLTGRNVLNEPLFVCTACGGPMIGYQPTRRNIAKYICSTVAYRGGEACTYRPIDQEPLDRAVLEHIGNVFGNETSVEDFIRELRELTEDDRQVLEMARKTLRARVGELQRKIDRLVVAITQGVDAHTMRDAIAKLKAERAEAEKELESLEPTAPVFDEAKIRAACKDLGRVLAGGDPAAKKDYVRKCVRRLEFDPATGEVRVHTFQAPMHTLDSASIARERVSERSGARDET